MSRVARKNTSRKRFSSVIGNLKSVLNNLFGNGDQPEIDSLEAYVNSSNAKYKETAKALLESTKSINKQVEVSQKKKDKEFDNLKYDVPGIDGASFNDQKIPSHNKEHGER